MSDASPRPDDSQGPSALDELINNAATAPSTFTTVFRGYDRDEVDAVIAALHGRIEAERDRVGEVEERQREALAAAESDALAAAERHRAALAEASSITSDVTRLEAELAAATARAADAEKKVQTLADELTGTVADSEQRQQFDDILRVAEEQAAQIIKNATQQADRLLEVAREEIETRRKDQQLDADAVRSQAEHDAQQVRLRIDTELTAHQAQLERESSHAAEKVAQAEREAAAIRSESEKAAAALRSLVNRETSQQRSEAEDAVRELRLRALEFEESLTRRQDDAQQEFLMLHNQAVAHAERITQDANDQVSASLEHAQRVAARADDHDRLMRAQAQQIEADANVRARELTDRARDKAQRIIDTVSNHSNAVLRDAEDRARQLRWQQHQLTSFMSEVKELIRPSGSAPAAEDAEFESPEAAQTTEASSEPQES